MQKGNNMKISKNTFQKKMSMKTGNMVQDAIFSLLNKEILLGIIRKKTKQCLNHNKNMIKYLPNDHAFALPSQILKQTHNNLIWVNNEG